MREGRGFSDIFAAVESSNTATHYHAGVSTTNERHPRQFHCRAVRAVARYLRLSSLELKKKMRAKTETSLFELEMKQMLKPVHKNLTLCI